MIVMAQQCEAPECREPADFTIDSPTPGGTIHLCAKHTPRCDMLRGDTPCGAPAVVATRSRGQILHFCADCATWGL